MAAFAEDFGKEIDDARLHFLARLVVLAAFEDVRRAAGDISAITIVTGIALSSSASCFGISASSVRQPREAESI